MAYNTLQELTDRIVDWLDRDDIRDKIKDFAHLTQGDAVRKLEIREMEKSKVIDVTGDGKFLVPFDAKQAISVTWLTYEGNLVTRKKPLKRSSVYQYNLSALYPDSNEPNSFSRIKNSYVVFPLPPVDDDIIDNVIVNTKVVGKVEFTYYAYPLELGDYTKTNWMIQYYPDLMFYGCMMHGNRYIRDFEQASYWEKHFDELLGQIQHESDVADEAGGVWEMGCGSDPYTCYT